MTYHPELMGHKDSDAARARRAVRFLPQVRIIEVRGKRYAAYSAHELLDYDSRDLGRPGIPY